MIVALVIQPSRHINIYSILITNYLDDGKLTTRRDVNIKIEKNSKSSQSILIFVITQQ